MQLTRHADYALRLLIILAKTGGERLSVAAVAENQAISRTHLMKIANHLAHAGFVEATRGRGGGLRLAQDPATINLGAVVAEMEPRCAMIDCTDCRLSRKCGLPAVLADARRAFVMQLSKSTLADVIKA